MKGDRVAIIGAGVSGLTTAKACLESGLVPIVFEKQINLGGIWSPDTGKTWDSMHTNLSHFSCRFSDFPWPDETEAFPSRNNVYAYLHQYVRHFNLSSHIHFNTKVCFLREEEDGWLIQYLKEGTEFIEKFNYVVIASGIFSDPSLPEIEGIDSFKGELLHSESYKKHDGFSGKTVAVVGSSFTGTEIAADIGEVANVNHVIRNPYWVLPRHLSGKPIDLAFYSRKAQAESLNIEALEYNQRKHHFFSNVSNQNDFSDLRLPVESTLPPYVVISDRYLSSVTNGKIQVKKGEIARLTESAIEFIDGTQLQTDVIVMCTGYKVNLSFMNAETQRILNYNPENQFQPLLLYKCTFHPDLLNIAFVGVYRGPYFLIMELQARWLSQVFSGDVNLPSKGVMEDGIVEELRIREERPRPQFPHGDYVALSDSIAQEIGIKPDLEKLRIEDPDLYKVFYEGPLLPEHFRFFGNGNQRETALPSILKINQFFSP